MAYRGYTNSAKQNSIQAQHREIAQYVITEFKKCDLGYEYIFSTTSGETSKCSALSSGSDSTDPGTDVGTALKEKIKNIFEQNKLAFMLVTTTESEKIQIGYKSD